MSKRHKVEFPGSNGARLAGILEMPEGREPRAYALFAHCFTCGKDVLSASRVARRLADLGIAVLRFDFTGLGESQGSFADTNFSSNVEDLLCAAGFLRKVHRPVDLLIGHSLGGAAVLAAAGDIPEARAIVTIAAPASPDHVVKQFACTLDTIRHQGQAEVELAGRPFVIKKQFLDDLDKHKADYIGDLGRPLLIYHSPVDRTVSIDEAAEIYNRARHPKSFISLDRADHLLTRRADADYLANTLAAWAEPYLSGKRG
ncbi:alpha/beta hydrolase family protein [Microbulbifer thermotolerans]|uniref:Osmotically inducible protein OsmC n=1 Tax=Microbulbifer thermotolerans TaxID=252514 RepID=A0A143HPH9_MICTH|nr:alpha/beta hydrolase [Microbulbifer thermotolerans]AMX03623.1 osmotically inducible protein OsmC [Microbulbifer thermotolerans]